jgi:spermidine synthase
VAVNFQVIAYEDTPLGLLCLRRRMTLKEPIQWVTEITLNHEFLMSSLHTDSERALADIPLTQHGGEKLDVMIGGLGLGYTAHSALAFEHVASVEVVEVLPQVIQWMRDELTPLGSELNASPRLVVAEGDIFDRLLSRPSGRLFDAILIDVDHSPEDQLGSGDHSLYCARGLEAASRHLRHRGVFALWSYDQHTPLFDAMQQVFEDPSAHPIIYFNQHVDESFTDWLYVGRRKEHDGLA